MEYVKRLLQKLKPLLNKYIIAITVIFVFIFFLDENSVVKRIRLNREISGLKKEIRHYEDQRNDCIKKLNSLHAGKDELERVAREEYLMKKDSEELFVIEEEK
ncbi:MAG: septum formation initiator family protein [Bacteroidota bacterium]|nr:septum formation initiator family protein [Bacteroidota bacterium]